MRVDFELIVRDYVPDDRIASALAAAYDVSVGSVEVQDMADSSPIHETTRIWCRRDSVPGEFATFLLIYLCGATSDLDFLSIAARISHVLGSDCLVSDDESPVASSMFLIRGLASPQKVELIDDQDEDSSDTVYTLKRT